MPVDLPSLSTVTLNGQWILLGDCRRTQMDEVSGKKCYDNTLIMKSMLMMDDG